MRCAGEVKGGDIAECDPVAEGRWVGTDAARAAIG